MPIENTSIDDFDFMVFKDYYKSLFDREYENEDIDVNRILNNLLLTKNNKLTLAGLLFFGKDPKLIRPYFSVHAVRFQGNDASGDLYHDSENIHGVLLKQYKDSHDFILRNLKKVQGNKGFNSVGDSEIPKIVIEELLVNALIHRDYFITAPINIFIFDDRIEIISPGKLPNSLTIENIKYGISVLRNPLIASLSSKILPYRGIGTGIIRCIKNHDRISFENDIDNYRFRVIVYR